MTGPAQRPAEPTRSAGAGPPGARSRPHFTGRAAVLAIVLCGIALSLAYPVREYISQRKQIDQLLAANARINAHKEQLKAEYRMLHSSVYIEAQARDRLHMCLPDQICYEIIGSATKPKVVAEKVTQVPWYARMWSSVQVADSKSASYKSTGGKSHRPGGARGPGPKHRHSGSHRG
ncbi:MAG TPA: septum formation initiator family protein [Streptosporangiaceae bacterium]|nr:septum formation initiator family protein [Streptosporangiaceae bacterium]